MKCGVVKSLCKCISQLIGFCDEEIKKWHKSSRSAKRPLLSVLFGCFALILLSPYLIMSPVIFIRLLPRGLRHYCGIGVIGAHVL